MNRQDICVMLDTENKETEQKMSVNGKDYKLEVELLRRDVDTINKIHDRMDASIHKMENVADEMSRMIYAQDQKFKYQEKINTDMEKSLEEHIKESEERSKQLNTKIENVDSKLQSINIELTQKIQQSQTTIVDEMLRGRVELRDEINKISENLNKKVGEIDMWRYMIMGGIALFIFLVGNMSGLTKFFR